MHIAVFGGSFNPIHYGHLRIAEEVLEGVGPDKVVFMPSCITPHKAGEELLDPLLRLEMLRIAIMGNPGLDASDIEIKRGGRSYTIDTVKELKGSPEDGKAPSISLIVGTDSFNEITTWCEYEELFTLASFIVVGRPGHPAKKPAEALPVELARKFWYDAPTESYRNSYGNSVVYPATTMMGISSSGIRERIGDNRSVRYLLPDAVIGFIREMGLYRA
ncbi:MAG: nicotinate (nicotinamide) nucleotide adenylyltransferase [Deltaproteobacteria bacterium]|nr:nicotinate (nicotinamide) nucleotide adenylyltransferase [Deltaproteobacteria bacterium]